MKNIDSFKALITEVETLKENEKFADALILLEQSIIKYKSDDYRIYEEIADIHIFSQKIEEASKAIDYALTLNPESATGNYLKGFLMLSSEKVTESIPFLEKSNSLLGNNTEVLRNLWFAYTLSGSYDRGISILKRALHLNPWDELITEDLAMALISHWDVLEWNVLLRQIEKTRAS